MSVSLLAVASRPEDTNEAWLEGVHLQRDSVVRTGGEKSHGGLWVHTSDLPTFFHDWGQSRRMETATSAPNEPY